MKPGRLLPELRAGTRVEEWKVADFPDRTLLVRVSLWTMSDSEGKLRCAAATPLAIIVVDSQGRSVIPLAGGDEEGNG